MSASLLVEVLREPQRGETLSTAQWSDLICVARAERLLATLALRLKGLAIPARIAARRSCSDSSNIASAFSSETNATSVPRGSSWLVLS